MMVYRTNVAVCPARDSMRVSGESPSCCSSAVVCNLYVFSAEAEYNIQDDIIMVITIMMSNTSHTHSITI